MTDLVERYVHQVGRYLPRKERAEIEVELRSIIEDQLSDRYEHTPSPEEVALVLSSFGDPRQLAASYGDQQYLVGPDLYPHLMAVLRYGWLLLPALVFSLNFFSGLVAVEPVVWLDLLGQTVWAALQVTLIFSAVTVLIFAIIQHSGIDADAKPAFDPLALPSVDDPTVVDRTEAIFGSIFGALFCLLLLYFLSVGGLTLRFDLNNPGDVIPVPAVWLLVLFAAAVVMIGLHVVVLRRNRWSAGLWLLQTALEVVGNVCLYFVLYRPLFDRLLVANPELASVPVIGQTPELLAVAAVISTLVTRGSRPVRLWNHRQQHETPFAVKPDA